MANHTLDCKYCGADLRLEHPYDVNVIHTNGLCKNGEELCQFCYKNPVMTDDCGEWTLWPDPDIETGRRTCEECYHGAPGKLHIKRYGVGDR